MFYCMFYFTCDRSLRERNAEDVDGEWRGNISSILLKNLGRCELNSSGETRPKSTSIFMI